MKRLLIFFVVGLAVFKLARRMPERLTRLMEQMMEHAMPRMMDACFAQMGPERRRFMLDHCRSLLDKMQAKYVTAKAAAGENTGN